MKEIEITDMDQVTISPVIGGVMLTVTPDDGPTQSFILTEEAARKFAAALQEHDLQKAERS